jgi:mono/diheme cytochrome c family protein
MTGQIYAQWVRRIVGRPVGVAGLLAAAVFVLAACQPVQPPAAPQEAPAAAAAESAPAEAAAPAGDPIAGSYLFSVAMGCGCHFNRDLGGLAGGNKFEGPFGVVHSANLTADPDTGLGSWSDQQIADAIRFGKRNDGTNLAPMMPRFATLADKDVLDLVAFVRTFEPIANAVPAPELAVEMPDFVPQTPPPATAPTAPAARGQYLASLVRCGQCHTPTNEDGSPNMALFLAGAPFRDTVAPNLTPDEATGLGAWSEQEIADFLRTGIYADGLESHPGMKGVVDRGLKNLTNEDALAIAAFLKSLPPTENLPQVQQ